MDYIHLHHKELCSNSTFEVKPQPDCQPAPEVSAAGGVCGCMQERAVWLDGGRRRTSGTQTGFALIASARA